MLGVPKLADAAEIKAASADRTQVLASASEMTGAISEGYPMPPNPKKSTAKSMTLFANPPAGRVGRLTAVGRSSKNHTHTHTHTFDTHIPLPHPLPGTLLGSIAEPLY